MHESVSATRPFVPSVFEPHISNFVNITLWKLVPTREILVSIRHIFRTNISHFVKNTHEVKIHIAYVRIPHIDEILLKYAANYIRFQFFTVLSLTSVTIKYQLFTHVIIWNFFFYLCEDLIPVQLLHMCEFGYQSFTFNDLIPIFHRCEYLIPILLTCENLVQILHICEYLAPNLHIWEKSYRLFTR